MQPTFGFSLCSHFDACRSPQLAQAQATTGLHCMHFFLPVVHPHFVLSTAHPSSIQPILLLRVAFSFFFSFWKREWQLFYSQASSSVGARVQLPAPGQLTGDHRAAAARRDTGQPAARPRRSRRRQALTSAHRLIERRRSRSWGARIVPRGYGLCCSTATAPGGQGRCTHTSENWCMPCRPRCAIHGEFLIRHRYHPLHKNSANRELVLW